MALTLAAPPLERGDFHRSQLVEQRFASAGRHSAHQCEGGGVVQAGPAGRPISPLGEQPHEELQGIPVLGPDEDLGCRRLHLAIQAEEGQGLVFLAVVWQASEESLDHRYAFFARASDSSAR